jgi:hypothetical protein
MKKHIPLLIVFFWFSLRSYSQTYFDLTRDFPCSGCQNYNANFNTIKHCSTKEIKIAFDSICQSGIEFNYPQGGCQNRAQIMSMMLSKKFNIQHCKIWLFPPADLVDGDTKALQLNDKNQLSPDNIVKWLYHVAPCVLVDNNGKVDTLIIDPSIDNTQLLKLSEWLKKITNSNVSKYTFLNPEWYFFITRNSTKTSDNSKINGEFYKFEADPRGWINNYSNLALEKSLAINDLTIYILKKYITRLRGSNNQSDATKLNDLKKAFGNVDALTVLFGSQASYMGNTVPENIYIRSLQEAYPDLMNDAMKYYINRVGYWTKKVVTLK